MDDGLSNRATSSGGITADLLLEQPPREWEIGDWETLAGFAKLCTNRNFIFRGERLPDPQHPLRPKAGRVDGETPARRVPYNASDERKALEDFKRQGRPHVHHEPQSDVEWLAIAQHHGMSTRLLDWTESLLAAAYFATEQMNTGPGLIYALPAPLELSSVEVLDPFSVQRVGLYKPPHISVRIPAQRSVFTLHPDPTQAYKPAELCEWRITPEGAAEIKEVLDSCGINLSSLFPDLDGLARYMAWRYKWGA